MSTNGEAPQWPPGYIQRLPIGSLDVGSRLEGLAETQAQLVEMVAEDGSDVAVWALWRQAPSLTGSKLRRELRKLPGADGHETSLFDHSPQPAAGPKEDGHASIRHPLMAGGSSREFNGHGNLLAALGIGISVAAVLVTCGALLQSKPSHEEQVEAMGYVLETPEELRRRGLCAPELVAEASLKERGFSSGDASDNLLAASQLWQASELAEQYNTPCAAQLPVKGGLWVKTSSGNQVLVTLVDVTRFDAAYPCDKLQDLRDDREDSEPGTYEWQALNERIRLQAGIAEQIGITCM
jgi:hypothetical protein